MGYSTLYGDTNGAIMPIGDVYKSDVFDMAHWVNRNWGRPIPENTISKPPSAELAPGQVLRRPWRLARPSVPGHRQCVIAHRPMTRTLRGRQELRVLVPSALLTLVIVSVGTVNGKVTGVAA